MTMTVSAGATAMDMTAMREVLAAGRVTPAALIDQAIARAEAVNPELNFIAWPTFERARAQATAPRSGPLAGIPTLIKDMLPEKGIPASFGSAALKGFIPPDDAPYARAISNAGPLRSEEHTSELQSLMRTSYAVFCLEKNKPQASNKCIDDSSILMDHK